MRAIPGGLQGPGQGRAITLSDFLETKAWLSEVRERLDSYAMICNDLAEIAEKERKSARLTIEEHYYLLTTAGRLKSATNLGWELMQEITDPYQDSRMAVVADVLTETNTNQCLEEAVGNPAWLLVLVSIDGKPCIAEGACFTYYEFKQPIAERLSDPEWQDILDKKRPETPEWVGEITGKLSGRGPGY